MATFRLRLFSPKLLEALSVLQALIHRSLNALKYLSLYSLMKKNKREDDL